MKKLLTIALLFIMLTMVVMTAVNAATSNNLPDEIYAIGSKYGMKESDKLRMVRYLSDYPLSDEKCNEILALANQADKIMQENGTTDYKSLPTDVKAQLRTLANDAASIAGVTLNFSADGIEVYKDGKLVESVSESGTLPYTGNNVNVIAIGSSILAIVGLAVIAKKIIK